MINFSTIQKTIFLSICFLFYWQILKAQTDSIASKELDEIIISASKTKENILKSPISIEKIGTRTLRASPKFSAFDMLENVKGLQILIPSLGFKVFNARGFANTTNVRFVQLVDGMDNQAPHIGSPLASVLMPSDLDIQNIEIVPGVSSAVFGMNSLNGLVNVISKNPFDFQGLDVQQKVGFNHFNNPSNDINPQVFSETNLRFAKSVHPKWAFKVNFTYLKGYDWIASSQTDLNPNANSSTQLFGLDNPAFDAVNSYGNESPNRRTLNLGGKNYVVSRTGYYENEIADYNLQNIKTDAAIHFRPKENIEIIYTYRFADLDNVYQRTNRFRLNNYRLQQHGLSFQSPFISAKAYLTTENTGQSYNIRSIAENIDRFFKTDNQWFSNFTSTYNTAVTNGQNVTQALQTARQNADFGRPQTGTAQFNHLIDSLGNINNWDIGAALRVRAYMLQSELQYELDKHLFPAFAEKSGFKMMLGLDYRDFIVIPDGNYFINPKEAGKNLNYYKYGGFLQTTKSFWGDKLKAALILRLDKIVYFSAKFNPRFSLLYLPFQNHSIRFSIQRGNRFPSLFEGFSNVNSGGVKRVGGFPVMSNGIFENSYFRTSIDAFQRAVLTDVNTNGLTTNQAIEKNKGILSKNTYTYIQPEKVTAFEIGYKTNLWKNKLTFDADFYYNIYQNFIAQVEVNIPKTSLADSIPYYLNNPTRQDRYRLWTNSKSTVYNYGATLGMQYLFWEKFQVSGNVTYSKLDSKTNNDGLEEAFNTPTWIYNIQLNNPNVYKNLGFGLTYRWQSAYLWQSALATGDVATYNTIDAQISYTLPKSGLIFRLGANNLLNQYYYSFVGSPQIGGFYYLSVTFSGL